MKSLLFTLLIGIFVSSASASRTTIASYNIRNFDHDFRAGATDTVELVKVIRATRADLIGVQEIVNASSMQRFVEENFPEYAVILSQCGGSGRQKLGFLYLKSRFSLLSFTEDHRLSLAGSSCGSLRPAAIAEFRDEENGKEFIAINVHLKAGGRPKNIKRRARQYRALAEILDDLKYSGNHEFVVLGDFNTTQFLTRDEHYQRFIDFTDNSGLNILSEHLNCSMFWTGGVSDGLFYGSLLDHILVSPSFKRSYGYRETRVDSHCRKVACEASSSDELGVSFKKVSDHCPVISEFSSSLEN